MPKWRNGSPAKVALEIDPGNAFSVDNVNVKVSPSQCVKSNVWFFGPSDRRSWPSW